MSSVFLTIWRKEMVDAVRDRRSLMAAMSYALFGPLLMAVAFMVLIKDVVSERDVRVHIDGAEYAPALVEFLEARRILAGTEDHPPQDIWLTIPEDYQNRMERGRPIPIVVRSDYSERSLQSQRTRLESALREYNQTIAMHRLTLRGISGEVIQPLQVDRQDTATKGSRAALVLGMVMVFVLMSVFFSGMNVAIDTSAGERERNALEFLLAQPVATHLLVSAKMTAAATFAILGGLLALLLIPAVFLFVPLEKLGIDFAFTPMDQLIIAVALIPLALFASILQLFVSFRAKSFKEAQTYISLVMFAPMAAVFALEFSRFEHPVLQVLPVTSQHHVLFSTIAGQPIAFLPVLLGGLVTLLLTGVLVWVVTRMLRSEKVVFGL